MIRVMDLQRSLRFGHAGTGLVLAGLLAVALPAGAAIKCWTNDEGNRECGDKVPPEYAQKKRQIINEQGIVIEEQERALTKEEWAQEQERLQQEAEQQRLQEEQARQDSILLDTYFREEDIVTDKEGEERIVKARIELAHQQIEKLQEQIKFNENRKQDFMDKEMEAPPALDKNLESLQDRIEDRRSYIQKQEQELEKLGKLYDGYLKRYRELKGSPPQAESTP